MSISKLINLAKEMNNRNTLPSVSENIIQIDKDLKNEGIPSLDILLNNHDITTQKYSNSILIGGGNSDALNERFLLELKYINRHLQEKKSFYGIDLENKIKQIGGMQLPEGSTITDAINQTKKNNEKRAARGLGPDLRDAVDAESMRRTFDEPTVPSTLENNDSEEPDSGLDTSGLGTEGLGEPDSGLGTSGLGTSGLEPSPGTKPPLDALLTPDLPTLDPVRGNTAMAAFIKENKAPKEEKVNPHVYEYLYKTNFNLFEQSAYGTRVFEKIGGNDRRSSLLECWNKARGKENFADAIYNICSKGSVSPDQVKPLFADFDDDDDDEKPTSGTTSGTSGPTTGTTTGQKPPVAGPTSGLGTSGLEPPVVGPTTGPTEPTTKPQVGDDNKININVNDVEERDLTAEEKDALSKAFSEDGLMVDPNQQGGQYSTLYECMLNKNSKNLKECLNSLKKHENFKEIANIEVNSTKPIVLLRSLEKFGLKRNGNRMETVNEWLNRKGSKYYDSVNNRDGKKMLE